LKILAVGAHPDDIEVGCAATLALFKRKGYEVYFLVLTKGEASGDPEIRERECINAAGVIGVDNVYFGGLRDTKITDEVTTIIEVENVINEVKPDILFVHSPKDTHQDHRGTALAAMSAGRKMKNILLYESPAALREFCPQIFIDVESTFNVKIDALKMFMSQNSKSFCEDLFTRDEGSRMLHIISAMEGLARFRGFQIGVKMAEAFEVGRFILEI
jgi:LmbE family N-acetylglucosaminyl deacetylase